MSYNAEYSIESNNISQSMDFIEESLCNYKLNNRDLIEALLISEEVLIQLAEKAPKGATVKVCVSKRLGVPRINFVAPGDNINLGEQTSGISLEELSDTEEQIRNMMLHSFSDSIRYRHSKQINFVTILTGIPERELASQTIFALVSAIIIGTLFQFVLPQNINSGIITNFLKPVETLFLSCLSFIAAPAIFVSITCSILRFEGFSELNKSGKRVILAYMGTSLMAILIGLATFYLFKPGKEEILTSRVLLESTGNFSVLDIITHSIPANIIEPFTTGNSLQLLIAAMLIGFALNISNKKVSTLKVLLEELDILCGNVASIIMKTVPFVVFCSTTQVFLLANLDVYASIGHLILTLFVGLIFMVLLYSSFLAIRLKLNPFIFLIKYFPVMKDTFLKGSSLAAIPLTLRFCKRQLGIPQNLSSFVIPLGATINMDGTCVCLTILCLFFARICGVALAINDIAILLFMIFVLSLGAPIAPGTIILCMVTLFSQIGLSIEGISLIIGLNFILEMLLGMINSMGDVVVALEVAKREGGLKYDICNKMPDGFFKKKSKNRRIK